MMRAAAVGLVTSGSRGTRLVFYYKEKGSTISDVSSVLPPTTLAEILAPSSLMVDRKFELTVDSWKFIGHPFFVQNGLFSITFNVVFVLESYCSDEVVSAYNHLSHSIGSAIVHEEMKCGFLCQEVKLLMQLLEDADIPDPSSGVLVKKSLLAQSLSSVIDSLSEEKTHMQVMINNWSEVNCLMKFKSTYIEEVDRGEIIAKGIIVRSYSALLLFENADDIISSLPSTANPAMQRLLTVVSPLKNLQSVSLDADIPLMLVLHLASHLVHWGKAMPIYPLSENNIYITSPTADTRIGSELSDQFSIKFPGQSLADILSQFSLPVTLGEIKDTIEDERIVIWLLQTKQISQIHTYIYIVPMETDKSPGETDEELDNVNKGETMTSSLQLLTHLSPRERDCVLNTSAASNSEDLEEFSRLSKYFHGNHHLEGIMLMENIPRSQLLTLIDKFSEILVTCTLPEHSSQEAF